MLFLFHEHSNDLSAPPKWLDLQWAANHIRKGYKLLPLSTRLEVECSSTQSGFQPNKHFWCMTLCSNPLCHSHRPVAYSFLRWHKSLFAIPDTSTFKTTLYNPARDWLGNQKSSLYLIYPLLTFGFKWEDGKRSFIACYTIPQIFAVWGIHRNK